MTRSENYGLSLDFSQIQTFSGDFDDFVSWFDDDHEKKKTWLTIVNVLNDNLGSVYRIKDLRY